MSIPYKTLAAALAAGLAISLPAHAQQKVKIGFITTMSGPQGVIGKHMRDAVEQAIMPPVIFVVCS